MMIPILEIIKRYILWLAKFNDNFTGEWLLLDKECEVTGSKVNLLSGLQVIQKK